MKLYRKFSLLTKLSVALMMSILIIEMIIFIPSLMRREKELLNQLTDYNLSIFKAIEKSMMHYLLLSDVSHIKMLLDIFKEKAGFKGYLVTDDQDETIITPHSKFNIDTFKSLQWHYLREAGYFWSNIKERDSIYYKYEVSSVQDQKSYAFYLVYSKEPIQRAMRTYAQSIFLLIGIILIFTTLFIVIVLKVILIRPIKRIMKANIDMEFIDEKYFTNDEIGNIMRSRHQMLKRLEQHEKNLEDLIEERTKELKKAKKIT